MLKIALFFIATIVLAAIEVRLSRRLSQTMSADAGASTRT
jgi:hypothetical protein